MTIDPRPVFPFLTNKLFLNHRNTFCVYHVQYILKMMHERICDPTAVAANAGKWIDELPQDICSRRLGQGNISSSDRKLYNDVQSVVNDILKFDEYDKKTKGTLLMHASIGSKR